MKIFKKLFNKSRYSFSQKFRNYENATIVDHRINNSENPFFVLTCEHALNDLPVSYKWVNSDLSDFSNAHWSYDIGALKLAQNLAKKAKCILIHSNYSRLLCDVNRPVTSGTLFRKEGDGKEILLNKEITLKEEKYRLDNFYYSYYAAFREIALKTKPKILISLHSFNPIYEGVERDVEIGILSSFSDDLSLIIKNEFAVRNYKCETDKPWSGKEGFCFAIDQFQFILIVFDNISFYILSLILAEHPIHRKGVVIEFRNDLLTDPQKFSKISSDMEEILNKLKNT